MEAQQKGCNRLCTATFQLIILSLIAAKLEQSYPAGNDNSVGFSALWIIFPLLLVAGCMLLSWSCLIYGAGHQGLDNLVDKMAGKEEKDEEEENSASKETPIIVTPLAAAVTTTECNSKTPAPSFPNSIPDSEPKQSKADVSCYDDDID